MPEIISLKTLKSILRSFTGLFVIIWSVKAVACFKAWLSLELSLRKKYSTVLNSNSLNTQKTEFFLFYHINVKLKCS